MDQDFGGDILGDSQNILAKIPIQILPKIPPNMYLLYLPPKKGPKFQGTQRTGGQGPATSRYVFKLASNLLLPHLKLASNLLLHHSIQVDWLRYTRTAQEDNTLPNALKGQHSSYCIQRTTLHLLHPTYACSVSSNAPIFKKNSTKVPQWF